MRSFISEYRSYYDIDPKLKKSTSLLSQPLEQACFSKTGTSLTQLHNYYKHKVIARNRAEVGEFKDVLQDYDKLMKKSQRSMQKLQQHYDFHSILDVQPGDDDLTTISSTTGSNIVGEMLQELGGSTNSSISLNSGLQPIIGNNASYDLLEGQLTNSTSESTSAGSTSNSVSNSNSNSTVTSSSVYQAYLNN